MREICETDARAAEQSPGQPMPQMAMSTGLRQLWRWWLASLAILLLAAGLRLWQLKTYPPTPDEMQTILLLRLSHAKRTAMLASDVHPPLYYDLQSAFNRVMQRALGRPPGLKTMRVFPALLGVLSVGVLLWGAGRMAGRRAGAWAAAFWAVNPLAIGYAQTLRGYSLAVPLLIGCLLALPCLAGASTPRRRWLAAAALASCGLGLLYTHLLGGVFLAAVGLVWLFDVLMARDRRRFAVWLPGSCAFLAIALGFLPWVRHLAHQYVAYAGHGTARAAWPTLGDLYLGPFFSIFFKSPGIPAAMGWLLGLIVPFCLITGLWARHPAKAGGEKITVADSTPFTAGYLARRIGSVFLLAFVAVWLSSWREIVSLYLPARVLLAAVGVFAAALALASNIPTRRTATKGLLGVLALMLLISLGRPLFPQNYSPLWAEWLRRQPIAVLKILEGNPITRIPGPRVVYPDYWAGLIPPDSEGHRLIPFTEWIHNPQSREKEAVLINVIPSLHETATTSGTGRMAYVMVTAIKGSGLPFAINQQPGKSFTIQTSILKPFDPSSLYYEYDRMRQAIPLAGELEKCHNSVIASEMIQEPHGFYTLENDDALRFWRWTQGSLCQIAIPGPVAAGDVEVRLCLDRPQAHPAVLARWPWRLTDDSGRVVGKGVMEIPSGGPGVYHLQARLDRTVSRLELEFYPRPWQPAEFSPGTNDRRWLGGRFFWLGVH